MQNRIRDHIRANVVGYVALFFALSLGSAYATHPGGENTISSGDIINGEVRNADIGGNAVGSGEINDGAVRTPDIRNGVVNSAKVADGSLVGADLHAGTLTGRELATNSVGHLELKDGSVSSSKVQDETLTGDDIRDGTLTGDDVGDETLTGTDVANDSVGGADVDESTLNVESMGCQIGVIHGFARITSAGSIPNQFTESHIDRAYNCAGGPIEVRREGRGRYTVRFAGNPSTLPFTTTERGDLDNFVTSQLANNACAFDVADAPGSYCIYVLDNDADRQDGPFVILLP